MRKRLLALALCCASLLGAAGAYKGSAGTTCQAAIVHFKPHAGVAGSLRPLPWVGAAPASEQLVGLLWYWPNAWRAQHVSRATIYTNGHAPAGEPNMKILWAFLSPHAKTVTDAGQVVVKGRRLDGPGHTWQQFVAIGYSGQNGSPSYASIIDLPAAGCWQLDLRAGSLHATTVFRAIDR